MSHFKVLQ